MFIYDFFTTVNVSFIHILGYCILIEMHFFLYITVFLVVFFCSISQMFINQMPKYCKNIDFIWLILEKYFFPMNIIFLSNDTKCKYSQNVITINLVHYFTIRISQDTAKLAQYCLVTRYKTKSKQITVKILSLTK